MAERRMVRVRPAPARSAVEVEQILQSVAEIDRQLDQLVAARNALLPRLYTAMKRAGLATHSVRLQDVGTATATVYRPTGKATNVIDPRKFREYVRDDKDFYAAVTVGITKARTIVPARELAAMTTTTPARIGEETVKVEVK